MSPCHDRTLNGPREVDPLVGRTPCVVRGRDGVGLLVEHRVADFGDAALFLAEVVDQLECLARVGDVVDDEHPWSVNPRDSSRDGNMTGSERVSPTLVTPRRIRKRLACSPVRM